MIKKLIFDSSFFKKQIYQITLKCKNKKSELIGDIDKLSKKTGSCAYLEIRKNESELIKMCHEKKYFLADNRLYLKINSKIKEKHSSIYVETFGVNQIDIDLFSRELNKISRFYKDIKFRNQVRNLYQLWIEKSFYSNYTDKVFLTKKNGVLAGFISLKARDNKLYIDLLAIKKKYQRQGVGSKLADMALTWAFENHYPNIFVITQKDNYKSCNFYQKIGFKINKETFLFHIHL